MAEEGMRHGRASGEPATILELEHAAQVRARP